MVNLLNLKLILNIFLSFFWLKLREIAVNSQFMSFIELSEKKERNSLKLKQN